MSKFMTLVVVVLVAVVGLAAAAIIESLPRSGGDRVLTMLAPIALFVLSTSIALAWLCRQVEVMRDRVASLNEQIRGAKDEAASVKRLVLEAQTKSEP